MTMLRSTPHPNICPLLAAYRYGDKYNMLFPFADCNLRTYWEKRKAPQGHTLERLEFLTEIAALTEGLKKIHIVESEPGVSARIQHCGYHRDLKPTNILNKGRRFMIADFGLTRFKQLSPEALKREGSAGSGIPFKWGLSTYRAPECGEPQKAGRAADIWSLGCIFAEVMAYVVLGNDGPKDFSARRAKDGNGQDLFHDGTHKKESVEKFFQELEKEDVSDSFVVEWLGVIRLMLKSRRSKRLNVGEVDKLLKGVLERERAKLDESTNDNGVYISTPRCGYGPNDSPTVTHSSRRNSLEDEPYHFLQLTKSDLENAENMAASPNTGSVSPGTAVVANPFEQPSLSESPMPDYVSSSSSSTSVTTPVRPSAVVPAREITESPSTIPTALWNNLLRFPSINLFTSPKSDRRKGLDNPATSNRPPCQNSATDPFMQTHVRPRARSQPPPAGDTAVSMRPSRSQQPLRAEMHLLQTPSPRNYMPSAPIPILRSPPQNTSWLTPRSLGGSSRRTSVSSQSRDPMMGLSSQDTVSNFSHALYI